MTLLEFINQNPGWTILFGIFVVVPAVSSIAKAVGRALR